MTPPALLSAALLLLLLPPTLTNDNTVHFELSVRNKPMNFPQMNYIASVKYRGILLGGMTRLMNSTDTFKFTYTEDPDYGPYLESVNGVPGDPVEHTYWELLVTEPDGTTVRPDVGIGCYIPSEDEHVILNFTTWDEPAASGASKGFADHDDL